MSSISDRVLALAGVCQAAQLVQNLARQNQLDTQGFEAIIKSLLVTEPDNLEQIYGSPGNLAIGLKCLHSQLSNQAQAKDAEITRYIAAVLGLERKLHANKTKMDALGNGIAQVQRQLEHFELFSAQVLGNIANLYSDIVSPLAPRIQIAGSQSILSQTTNQYKVRALLLSGLRSAVLWRQLGGKRRHILWQRRQILKVSQSLLNQY